MSVTDKMMTYANKVKPVLKKIIPAFLLYRGKQELLNRITAQISQTTVDVYQPDAYPYGLNLIGPIDGATGLGQSFRLVERVVAQTEVPYLIYNYAQNTKNRIRITPYEAKIKEKLRYSINFWHVNPSEFAEAYSVMGRESFDRRYNIAYWLWELEEFPDKWVPYIRLLDEIWTPSEFISNSIRKKTDKPVYTVPYHVTAETDTVKYSRNYFRLPEKQFLFLMMYDIQSITERKNPDGVIQAFRKAFSPDNTEVGLVIKVNSSDAHDLEAIQKKLDGYENVYLINRNMEKIEVNSLIACTDVFVSLHRSEGFGLVLAEAMLNYVPVIATNWSANTEFMNPNVACMVDYEKVVLKKEIPPYRKGSCWAEPDLGKAAGYMLRLAGDTEYYRKLADKAYEYVSQELSLEKVKILIESRLQEIK